MPGRGWRSCPWTRAAARAGCSRHQPGLMNRKEAPARQAPDSPAFRRQLSRIRGIARCGHGKSRQLSAITLAYRFAPRWRRNGLEEQQTASLLPAGIPVVNPDVTAAEAVADLGRLPRWTYLMLLIAAPVMGLVFAVRGPRAFLRRRSHRQPRDLIICTQNDHSVEAGEPGRALANGDCSASTPSPQMGWSSGARWTPTRPPGSAAGPPSTSYTEITARPSEVTRSPTRSPRAAS